MVSSVTNVGENLQAFKTNMRTYSVNNTLPHPQETIKHKEAQPSKLRRGIAAATGMAAGLATPAYCLYDEIHKISPAEAKDAAITMLDFMPEADTLEHTKEIAAKVLEETGLKDKGVKVNFIDKSAESLDHLKEIIFKSVRYDNAYGRRMRSNYFETFKHGGNAAFFPDANEVVVNSKRLYSTVYHELGHAMNKNGNIFTRALQKARVITPHGVSIIAPIALAIGIFHKVDDNKPAEQKDKTEKSLDFISKHAGAITFASYAPMLAEEGLASIRGLIQAKKHLNSDIVMNMTKNYIKAWGTYAIIAGVVAGGVTLGIEAAKQIKNNFK